MTGKRIRCVCGTVFDPTATAACPACGAAAATDTTLSARAEAKGPTPDRPHSVESLATGVVHPPTPSLLQTHRNLVGVVVAAAIVIALGMIVRAKFGGAPPSKTTAKSGNDAVAVRGDESVQSIDPNEGKSPSPESSTITPAVQPKRPTPVAPASDLPAFKGKWKLLTARMQPEAVIPGLPVTRSILAHTVMTAFAGTGAVSTLNITDAGTYVLDVDVTGDGFYTSNITPDKHLLSVAAQGVLTLTPTGVDVSDRARVMLRPVKFDMPQMDVKANDTEMSLLPVGATGGAPSTWFRPGDSGREHGEILGTWTYPQVFVDSYMAYRGTLDLQDGGNYRIRFTRTEQGMLNAAGGDYEFKRSINMGPPVQGRYEFDGPNRFTLTEPRGTATWVREAGTAAPGAPKKPQPRGLRK